LAAYRIRCLTKRSFVERVAQAKERFVKHLTRDPPVGQKWRQSGGVENTWKRKTNVSLVFLPALHSPEENSFGMPPVGDAIGVAEGCNFLKRVGHATLFFCFAVAFFVSFAILFADDGNPVIYWTFLGLGCGSFVLSIFSCLVGCCSCCQPCCCVDVIVFLSLLSLLFDVFRVRPGWHRRRVPLLPTSNQLLRSNGAAVAFFGRFGRNKSPIKTPWLRLSLVLMSLLTRNS
jgi:hypothetical protein